jgi:hypothetical protein
MRLTRHVRGTFRPVEKTFVTDTGEKFQGLGGSLHDDPEVARAHYAICRSRWETGECKGPEIAGSEGRMLFIRKLLGGLTGPLHRCAICGCVAEIRVCTRGKCPKGAF